MSSTQLYNLIDSLDDVSLNSVENSSLLCINDIFPNEILVEILSKETLHKNLCNARLVCQRWRFVADEMVGYKVSMTSFLDVIKLSDGKLTKSKATPSLPRYLKDISHLADNSHLAIRDLTMGVRGLLTDESFTRVIEGISERSLGLFPTLVFPHVLKTLVFYEPVPGNIFSALKPLSTLQSLSMNLHALQHLKPDSFSELEPLRSLTQLIVSEAPAILESNNFKGLTETLNALMENLQAPNLTCLDVTYPIQSLLDVEEDSTRRLMSLVGRSPLLKKLSISICSPKQDIVPPSKSFRYPVDLLSDMQNLGNCLHLTTVELKDNHLHSLRPSTQAKAWIELMKTQKSLKSLKLELKSSMELSKDLAAILLWNANTLNRLQVSCFPCEINDDKDIFFVPIDCSFLKNCFVLEHLHVTDRLLNTTYLPNSLKLIYVDAMLTNEDTQSILLCDSGVLQRIELRDTRGGTPKGIGYGVTVDTLRKFVNFCPKKNRQLKVKQLLISVGCTDGKFPATGIPNGDKLQPMQLRKRKPPLKILEGFHDLSTWEYERMVNCIRIDWTLNERGYYEDSLVCRDCQSLRAKRTD